MKCPTCGGDTRVKSKHGDKRYRRCVSCNESIVTVETVPVEEKKTEGWWELSEVLQRLVREEIGRE